MQGSPSQKKQAAISTGNFDNLKKKYNPVVQTGYFEDAFDLEHEHFAAQSYFRLFLIYQVEKKKLNIALFGRNTEEVVRKDELLLRHILIDLSIPADTNTYFCELETEKAKIFFTLSTDPEALTAALNDFMKKSPILTSASAENLTSSSDSATPAGTPPLRPSRAIPAEVVPEPAPTPEFMKLALRTSARPAPPMEKSASSPDFRAVLRQTPPSSPAFRPIIKSPSTPAPAGMPAHIIVEKRFGVRLKPAAQPATPTTPSENTATPAARPSSAAPRERHSITPFQAHAFQRTSSFTNLEETRTLRRKKPDTPLGVSNG